MDKDLIVDVGESQVSIALFEDKRLVELSKETITPGHFSVGDIYLGRVHKVMPNLNAAFVDIGDEKDAFIHYLDLNLNFSDQDDYTKKMVQSKAAQDFYKDFKLGLPILPKDGKIADYLKPEQLILTQIVKEPISTKGSRLTSEISIAGRNMVLMPFSEKVSLSSKITSKEERRRLERLVYSILPPHYGLIVRTAAAGKMAAELDSELKNLIAKWESVWPKLLGATTPKRLLTETNRITTMLRDLFNDSFTSITVNDESAYNDICSYVSSIAPEHKDLVHLYKGTAPIFTALDVEKQIKGSFGRIVALKQGIYLIIEHTEALHVVDVNSGVRTKLAFDQEGNAFEVNMIAAEELARQMRLRDMGGIVIVDFIDMESPEHKLALYKHMQELMSSDRAKHNVLPLTKFGLMQITRQRVRPVTEVDTSEKCPTCNGTGKISATVVFEDILENQLMRLSTELGYKRLILKVHPFVEAYLNRGLFHTKAKAWQKKYNVRLKVIQDIDLGIVQAKWYDTKDIADHVIEI